MNLKEFSEKYKLFKDEFNAQNFDERTRTSRLMAYEAVRELIRSKKHLYDAIAQIDGRIKQLSIELDDFIKSDKNN